MEILRAISVLSGVSFVVSGVVTIIKMRRDSSSIGMDGADLVNGLHVYLQSQPFLCSLLSLPSSPNSNESDIEVVV